MHFQTYHNNSNGNYFLSPFGEYYPERTYIEIKKRGVYFSIQKGKYVSYIVHVFPDKSCATYDLEGGETIEEVKEAIKKVYNTFSGIEIIYS